MIESEYHSLLLELVTICMVSCLNKKKRIGDRYAFTEPRILQVDYRCIYMFHKLHKGAMNTSKVPSDIMFGQYPHHWSC